MAFRGSASRSIVWQNVECESAGVEADEVLSRDLFPGGIQRLLDPGVSRYAVKWFRSGDFAGWMIEDSKYLDSKVCLEFRLTYINVPLTYSAVTNLDISAP